MSHIQSSKFPATGITTRPLDMSDGEGFRLLFGAESFSLEEFFAQAGDDDEEDEEDEEDDDEDEDEDEDSEDADADFDEDDEDLDEDDDEPDDDEA